MWIRSQSLLTLANFECLKIRQYGSKEFGIVGDGDIILGKYSTVEKAINVLYEIQEKINYEHSYTIDLMDEKVYLLNEDVNIYQMPQDEDVEV